MSRIIDFFTGGIARWLVLGAVLAVAVVMLRMHWVQVGREQILRETAVAGVRLVVKQGAVTERVVTKYIKLKAATEIVTQYVEKEVTRYAESNPGYCLDAEWRRVHDAEALNTVPEAAGRPDAEGGAPKAATALATVTANYAACHRTADRLDALQEWAAGQAALAP